MKRLRSYLHLKHHQPPIFERKWIFPLAIGSLLSLFLLFLAALTSPDGVSFFPLYRSTTPSSSIFVESKLHPLPISSIPPPPRFAYLISGSIGDGVMIKRSLQALYHPINQYVVHLDLESSPQERQDLQDFVDNHPVFKHVGNVRMITKANLVTYRGPTMVANTLHAAAILLKHGGDWDWFINLSATDYPLVTQDDLLHTFSYLPRDLNFIDHTSNIGWKEFQRAKPVIVDPGLYMTKKADVFWITQRRSVPSAFKLFTGTSLVAWSKVTRPPHLGGLGIRPLSHIMRSLHAKWIWEVQDGAPALWKDIIIAKHRIKPLFWDTQTPNTSMGCSPWRGIWKTASWLFSKTKMVVGNGILTRFWKDRWCGDEDLAGSYPAIFALACDQRGSVETHKVGNGITTGWNLKLRREPREQELEQLQGLLAQLPNSTNSARRDRMAWRDNFKNLSVKTASEQMWEADLQPFPAKIIWNKWVPSKVGFFIWTLFHGGIPTHEMLKAKGFQLVSRCCLCHRQEENTQHLLWDCHITQDIIQRLYSNLGLTLSCVTPCDLVRFRDQHLTQIGRLITSVLPHAVLWGIWLERNARIFEGSVRTVPMIYDSILRSIWRWLRLNPMIQGVTQASFTRYWADLCVP